MGRKKKADLDEEEKIARLKGETVGWILAIGFFAVATFFVLASIDKAGIAGQKIYSLFNTLFGFGYYLLPTVSILLAFAYARSYIRPVTKIQCLGAFIFFVSSLSLTNILFVDKGGIIGKLLSAPLMALFDFYVTTIILISLIVVSTLVIFDVGINIPYILSIFKKKQVLEAEATQDMKIKGIDLENKAIEPKIQVPTLEQSKIPKTQNEIRDKEFGDLNLNSKMYSKEFVPPPLSLLEKDKGKPGVGDVKANANIIKRTLQNFGILVEMDEVSIGPSITRYAMKPAEGVKLSKILGLQNNLELALAAHPVRIEAPIPGKSLVGIEMPNTTKTTVGLGTLLGYNEYSDSEKPLMMALGKDISGGGYFANMAKMPHMLIAGATGSGKSVTIHALINSLLFRNPPSSLKFIMIDPKRVELTLYNKIPHLLTPVVTEPKKAIQALKWAAKEMDRRYNILEQNKVRDIDSYHKTILTPALEKMKKDPEKMIEVMPYIVIIIDELADIMQAYPRELESAIVRLAQMSRAVGIHLILSTQRPSVNVITGLIKANVPARIALQVASQIDSRTILDMAGAEKLLGAGDMLFMSGDMSKPVRLQCPYISETEVKKVVDYLKANYEDEIPNEINLDATKGSNVVFDSIIDGGNSGSEEDDLYDEAKDIVVRSGKASTSFLQRKLRIGYARAARIMDILEEHSVIGPGDGAKQRDVLIKPDEGFTPAEEDADESDIGKDYE